MSLPKADPSVRLSEPAGRWTLVVTAAGSGLVLLEATVVNVGLGIPLMTPAITATVLSAVPDARAGIASAVNNGVARTAGLLVVAALPLLARLPQDAAGDPVALDNGFDRSMLLGAGLFVLGGLVTWFGISRPATITLVRRHSCATTPQLELPQRS